MAAARWKARHRSHTVAAMGTPLSITYGSGQRFACELPTANVMGRARGPEPLPDVAAAARDAIAHPLDFPPIAEAAVPGDRVVIAVERNVPQVAEIVLALWEALESRGVEPLDVRLLNPAALDSTPTDPRALLPDHVRSAMTWHTHDATDENIRSYLASSAGGERVYLASELTDADLVIPIGVVEFDPALGYAGTSSVLYPGFSSVEAIAQLRNEGHDELTPDDPRATRQLVDEVGWLLGVQATIQLVRARAGGVAAVLAGAAESVLEHGKTLLRDSWQLEIRQRPDVVVVGVDADAGGRTTWTGVTAAVETARRLVAREGRVVVISDLEATPGRGLEIISESRSPQEAAGPIRDLTPPDTREATRLLRTLEWSNVYLFSKLAPSTVEDLFMMPLETDGEVRRLLESADRCLFVEGAQFVAGRAGAD